jgi:hypothetical protein
MVTIFNEETEQDRLTREKYLGEMKSVRNLFSTEEGKRVLEILRKRNTQTSFDATNPSERALYQQGKIDAINEIQNIIDGINNGTI